MKATDNDQLSEYEAAMLLPRSGQVELLHHYAAEYQQSHGGPHLEGALRTAQLIRERWEHDLPRVGQDGFRPFVGTREATRCCVLAESLHRRLIELRNRAYRWARARLWHLDGVRIDFPRAFEPESTTAPAAHAPQPRAEVEAPGSQTAASQQAEATTAPEELATKRNVRDTMHRLHLRGVKGSDLQAFKKRCLAGDVTVAQMREMARELLSAVHAA